jgi:hypothetical protein
MPNTKTRTDINTKARDNRTKRRARSGGRTTRTAALPVARRPWEILDGETGPSYELFKVFRDMNPIERSLAAVAKIFDKGMSTVASLSADYNWMARAAAWDFHIEQARLELSEQYQLDMFKRHTDVCISLIDKVKQRLEKMKPAELKPRDVVQWIDIATKIERMSRGVANDAAVANLTQINVQVENMSRLPDEELERIIDAEKKRKMRLGAIDVKSLAEDNGNQRGKD